jgi:hypothetical protein
MNHLINLLVLVISFCEYIFFPYNIILPLTHGYSIRCAIQTIPVSRCHLIRIVVYVNYFLLSLSEKIITSCNRLCKIGAYIHFFSVSAYNPFFKWMHGNLFPGIKHAIDISSGHSSISIFKFSGDTHHSFLMHRLALVIVLK